MRLGLLIMTLFLGVQVFAQTPDTAKVYTSMEEALVSPESVLYLDLSRQKLKELPASISQFTNLKELNLNKNKLSEFPEAIVKLTHLEKLVISKNDFQFLPAQICRLTELKSLDMSNNDIESFPACIGQLKQLEYIDASSNNLGIYPSEMAGLTALKELDLRVISLSDDEQQRIITLLPKSCKIRFSSSCNCGF